MSANFEPNQNEYKNLTPFKTWLLLQINTWGMTNFPFVESDFDELTNYGMMQKLMGAVNDVISNENEVEQDMTNLFGAFTELQNYINNYFDNLDVQEEIDKKLDEMAEDGSLTNLISSYIDPMFSQLESNVTNQLSVQNTRIDNQNATIDELSVKINAVTNQNPIPVSSTSDMTDTTKVYLNTTNGYWYYYDGTNWTQGGIYQSTIDNNLTKQDTFLRDEKLNNLFGKNLYNKNTNYNVKGKYLTSAGYVTSSNYYISHPILVQAGIEYAFTSTQSVMGANGLAYAYVNPDGSIISASAGTIDSENNKVVFTAPSDGYVVINLTNRLNTRLAMVFSKNSDYDTSLVYSYENDDIIVSLSETKNKLDSRKVGNFVYSDNLFNKDSDLIIYNKYISAGGFVDSSSDTYAITHPIFLNTNDVVVFKHYRDTFGGNIIIALCDINGDYQDYVPYSKMNVDENDIVSYLVEQDGYYRFNVPYDIPSDNMIVKNIEYPETFVPFKNELINTTIPYIDEQISTIQLRTSPLYHKKITLNGDSICAGAGYGGGYGKIIADKFEMTYQNIAQGGATITSNQYTQGGTARHWINATITNMNSTYDYAIIEGGVNDASLSVPLGTISNGYDATLDTDTYIGAFENMLKNLVSRFAGKKYGYIAVHQMTANYRVINNESTSYYWASKKCCEKWGVPFLDLNVNVPPFAFLRNTSLSALPTAYTYNGDGWHPNEDGYKKYYVDKIIEWLESL